MTHHLDALFRPRSVAFSNLEPALKYHADIGFDGRTWVISPKYDTLGGFQCVSGIDDLPEAPDLAFVGIRRELAVEVISALRDKGCRAVVCNAAGFAEAGPDGENLQDRLIAAAGDMAMLGPNTVGLVNFIDPMAAMMDKFGVWEVDRGVAICSQGGGLLCDAVFSDRGLPITHLVGCGNQAVTGMEACVEYLLDDPRVTAVGLAFEALRDIRGLRRAAVKALDLGKPLVVIKFGKTAAGAKAAATHTASMAGVDAGWEALFDRLGIISTRSESEFLETLKLCHSGRIPKGGRVLVASASGVLGILLADHLSEAGFELPQPTGDVLTRLREVLPAMATPCNPQDVTMGVWNDVEGQTAIYSVLLDGDYDVALMVQNYPREGMWDVSDYEPQVEAFGAACAGRDVPAMQLTPLVDCFPKEARERTRALGLVAMQGLEEFVKALSHALWWRERRELLLIDGLERLVNVSVSTPLPREDRDEAVAKAMLATHGVAVPNSRMVPPSQAAEAAEEVGFPVAVKALDARLLHKTEVGAVCVDLATPGAVSNAVTLMKKDMARLAPDIPLERVLIEAMVPDVVAEIMASVTMDPSVGPVMMIARGGVEAELWDDKTTIAAPFDRAEIARAVTRLKVNEVLNGWRGRPAADRVALLNLLDRLAQFALTTGVEIEVNPILVGERGAWVVDAVLKNSGQGEMIPEAKAGMSDRHGTRYHGLRALRLRG